MISPFKKKLKGSKPVKPQFSFGILPFKPPLIDDCPIFSPIRAGIYQPGMELMTRIRYEIFST